MVYLSVDTEVHILLLHAAYIQSDWLREGGGSPQLFLNNGSVLRPEDPGCSYLGTAVSCHTWPNPTLHPQSALR